MPKKIKPEEEYDEEEDEEDEEEDEEEDGEDELAQLPPKRTAVRTQRIAQRNPNPRQPSRQQPEPLQKRYTHFNQPAVEGIMDGETQEVLATDTWAALADIIERLERIENSIGVMSG